MALSEEFKLDFKFGGNAEFLAKLEKLLERVDGSFDSVKDSISKTADATDDMVGSVNNLSREFNNSIGSMNSFGDKLNDIAKYYLSFQAAKMGAEKVWSFGMQSMDAFSTQEKAENQLKNVMTNHGTIDQFQSIKDYASQIQDRSIYGDEAMIKGAAELATYVQGTESLKSMMDLLTDYAAGMTGGGEVSPEQMESLATGLGMAYGGKYEAMNKKGFDTDKLKALDAISETGGKWGAKEKKKYGDVLDKDLLEEIKKAGGVTEQMRVAALKESLGDWDKLSDAVNELNSSALIRLNNKLGDLRENIGEKIYPTFNKLVDSIDKHLPDIEEMFSAIGDVFETIVNTINDNIDEIKTVFGIAAKAIKLFAEYPKATLAVGLGLRSIATGAFRASGQFGSLSKQMKMTTKDAMNFNVVAAAMAGGAIGASSMNTESMEGKGVAGIGGVLGGVAMAALGGAQAFGVLGAAVAAAAASIGAAFKSIKDEIDAMNKVKEAEKDFNKRRAMSDTLINLQSDVERARKKGYSGEPELKSLKMYVESYKEQFGEDSIPLGVKYTLAGGKKAYEAKLAMDAKRAEKAARKEQVLSRGVQYNQFNNTNIEQNVSLAADIQRVGILLNTSIRNLIEKQLKQNREISLVTGN